MIKSKKILKIILFLEIICLIIFPLHIPIIRNYQAKEVSRSIQNEIEELDQQIKLKQRKVEEIKRKTEYYQKIIETKRKEVLNLKNQISILDDRLEKANLAIQSTETKIDQVKLEIKRINLQIKDKTEKIKENKERVGETLRLIYLSDQQSLLEILLSNNSLADFFNQIKYSEDLQSDLQEKLNKLITIKQGLVVQKNDLERKKKELENLKDDLIVKKERLNAEKGLKNNILIQTKGAEEKFRLLLFEVRKEWEEVNSEIARLEKEIRKKLSLQKNLGGKLWSGGKLSWPVPYNGITCYFHDPDYPFRRWIGEHSGIDLRAAQGTPVRAAAPGYVARAKNGGLRGYSYVMIVHNDNISTIYGHLSKIYVSEDTFVSRGEVIGLSGGLPGTPGAGRFSTGPHLHFEVRLKGIPVNPLDYLE